MATLKTLPTRPLGRSGPLVPRLGLGLMGASGTYGAASSDADRFALLDEAYKRGERFWDTGKYPTARTQTKVLTIGKPTSMATPKTS
jgi:aryl-alcohol dehydrogenase-like predicted oxidoreductase